METSSTASLKDHALSLLRVGGEPGRELVQDFWIDEHKEAHLSEQGLLAAETFLRRVAGVGVKGDVYQHPVGMHALMLTLKATHAIQRDVDYVVSDGRVVAIDANTGRLEPSRHFDHGLHQSLEIKEGLANTPFSVTAATTSIPFLYEQMAHLAGMSGSAMSAHADLEDQYGKSIVEVKEREPSLLRRGVCDVMFNDDRARRAALIGHILAHRSLSHSAGEDNNLLPPMLIGVGSVGAADKFEEDLIEALKAHPHCPSLRVQKLTATHHHLEADMLQRAGDPNTITIMTAMAGRGTDIPLSGSDHQHKAWVLRHGGLHIFSLGRGLGARVDEQLKGRCARHGEPGACQFLLSMDDPLMVRLGQHPLLHAVGLQAAAASSRKNHETHKDTQDDAGPLWGELMILGAGASPTPHENQKNTAESRLFKLLDSAILKVQRQADASSQENQKTAKMFDGHIEAARSALEAHQRSFAHQLELSEKPAQ